MLTRLNLDLDSALIQLPQPALCIRLPKQHNPLAFQWQNQPFEIRSILLSEINDGLGLSLLIDIGETMHNGLFKVPIFTYRNFLRHEGLTVEQALASLGKGITADIGVQIPLPLIDDCARLSAPRSTGCYVVQDLTLSPALFTPRPATRLRSIAKARWPKRSAANTRRRKLQRPIAVEMGSATP
jgi:hypothetical protein